LINNYLATGGTSVDDPTSLEFELTHKKLVKRNGRVNSTGEHGPIFDRIEPIKVS